MATIESNVTASSPRSRGRDRTELVRQIAAMGEWFHNLDLNGVHTAPQHFLGDYPRVKWTQIASSVPADLSGATVLDVGCNAGFYCLEFKKRGARRVVGVDVDERYLNQARFAASVLDLDIEFQKRSVYEVDQIAGQFDYVLFMGVFYHLRYPLYALDKVITKVRSRLVFQTMVRGSTVSPQLREDYQFWDKQIFRDPDFPCMYFIEKKYAGDPT